MTLYERICRICERTRLHKVSNKYKDRDLNKAVVFLSPMMKLTPQGVVSASYCLSLLVFVILTSLLHVWGLSLPVLFLLSLIAALLTYFIILNFPISTMESYRVGLSEEADLVFEQFVLVFQSGGTIFDAIEMVANSDHPILSEKFQEILSKVNSGISPEECISDFAANQPSADLRRYLLSILSSLEQRTDLLDWIAGESFEADTSLRQRNLEIESRLLIVAALVTYLPIMLTLALSLAGHATNLGIILIVPIFILLNSLLRSRFTRSFSAYFDRPQSTGLATPSQRDIIREYDEFLNFMVLIGERLRMGDTLEVALPEVRDDVGPEVQSIIDPAIEMIYWKNQSLSDAMQTARDAALGQRVANLLAMIEKMCIASAVDAGERISRIASRLIKRSALAKERESIIAAQRLKVYVLSITSSMVLGLLTSLAPFLSIGELLSGGFTGTWNPPTLLEIYPLVLALALITTSSGYQNVRMVDGRLASFFAFLCLLLYLVSFFISSSIMGF